MKVLYFHQHFSTPEGATGIRSYEMARRLIARGHIVTIVCGSYGGGGTGFSSSFVRGRRTGIIDGINVIELDLAYSNSDSFIKRSMNFIRFAWKGVALGMTEKYDVLFATSTPLTAGIPGIFARWLRRKPFVFEVRDLWPELPKAMGVITNPLVLAGMSFLEWLTYRSATRCIGLSPGIVDGIVRRRVARERVALVPNGCDLGIFSAKAEAWRPDGISAKDLMVVFAGTHGRANGLDAVLSAAAELKRRARRDIKLLLIGQGGLKGELQARVEAEDMDNVIFHPPVNKVRLAGLMAATDVGMQILANVPAFYYGTSPNKFFDYLASGLPVLNNYPGWLAELIESHACGFAVRPDDPVAFADALETAASDKVALKEMGRRSLALARSDFDRAKLSERFVDWLELAKDDLK